MKSEESSSLFQTKQMNDWGPCPTALGTEISNPRTKTAARMPGQKTNQQTERYWACPIEMTLNFWEQSHSTFLGQFTERRACLGLLNTTIYAAALKTKPELVICKFCSCFAIKVCDQKRNGLVHKAELILFLHLSYFWVPITVSPNSFIWWSPMQKSPSSRRPNSFWKRWKSSLLVYVMDLLWCHLACCTINFELGLVFQVIFFFSGTAQGWQPWRCECPRAGVAKKAFGVGVFDLLRPSPCPSF